MNQFDALLSQISDLEGVNRDAERKILAIIQHSNAVESELAMSTCFWSFTTLKAFLFASSLVNLILYMSL
jgi:hypothetical protein